MRSRAAEGLMQRGQGGADLDGALRLVDEGDSFESEDEELDTATDF